MTIVDTSDAGFQFASAVYAWLCKHGIRPVVWKIAPEEERALAGFTDHTTEQRKREAERHAPLLHAIRQNGGR